MLETAPLSHLEIPHEQWPGEKVYYYCPKCDDVYGIPKAAENRCPECGRSDLKDIFVEISERLAKSWSFFEKTRYEKDKWLFRYKPVAFMCRQGIQPGYHRQLNFQGNGELRVVQLEDQLPAADHRLSDRRAGRSETRV